MQFKQGVRYIIQPIGQSHQWDQFLITVTEPPFEQSSAWARAREVEGWVGMQIMLLEGEEVVAGVQVLTWQLSRWGKIAMAPQGPCFSEKGVPYHNLLIQLVKQWLKKQGIIYLVWDINYKHPQWIKHLLHNGFSYKIEALPPHPIIKATLLLDLKPDIDTIFSQLRKYRKKNIKRGLMHPICHRLGSRHDLDLFFSLMLVMCERRNTTPTNRDVRFFYRLWDALQPYHGIMLHIAEYDNKPVCAMLCFTLGDTFRAFKWGWSGEYAELNITHVLYWRTIEWAKENGFQKYDFVQVDPDVAEAYIKGEDASGNLQERNFYGPTINKMRYGGELIHYPGVFIYFPNWLLRNMISFLVKFTIAEKLIARLVKRFYKR